MPNGKRLSFSMYKVAGLSLDKGIKFYYELFPDKCLFLPPQYGTTENIF